MHLQTMRTFADFLVDGASELWLESRYIGNNYGQLGCFLFNKLEPTYLTITGSIVATHWLHVMLCLNSTLSSLLCIIILECCLYF